MTRVSPGWRRASSGRSPRWFGKTAGQFEDEPFLLEHRECRLDGRLQDPVGVELLVGQVTYPPELGPLEEFVEPCPRASLVVETAPRDDAANP